MSIAILMQALATVGTVTHMPDAHRAPTLEDVARRAGVHSATVSRALSRPAMVAPDTRAQVLAAVEAVGFVPNRSARHLVSGRTGAIGLLVPDITNPFFGAILQAVQAEARGRDLAVLIADTGAESTEEQRALVTLGRQVDGLVVLTPITDLSSAPVPVVQVSRQSRLAPSVVVDQSAIVRLAIDHLRSLGHCHLVVVRGPAAYWSAGRRDRAVEMLAASSGDSGERLDVVGPVPGTFDGGQAVLDAVLATGATGVVAFNDVQAAGLLVAAQAAGLRVPEDLSVVGSDGIDLAAMTSPPLTTVAAPLEAIGRAAAERLDDLLAGRTGAHRTILQPDLVIGASTAPPLGVQPPRAPNRSSNDHPR